MNTFSSNTEMQKFEELLTPYIQGRLDDATRRKVEQFAERSGEFAELLRFEQSVAASVRSVADDAVVVAPSFGKLKQRIDAQSSTSRGFEVFMAGIHNLFRGINPGLVAAAFALFAIALFALQRPAILPDNDRFGTLSNGVSDIVAEPGRAYFRVVPSDDGKERHIENLATEFQFAVEAGPNQFGAYIVSIETSEDPTDAVLARWRSDERFMFVETAKVAKPK